MSDVLLKLAATGATAKVRFRDRFTSHTCRIIEMLKSGSADFEQCTDKDGNTAAHVAARYGKIDVLRALLDMSFDISKPSFLGNTSLHFAAAKGHVRHHTCSS